MFEETFAEDQRLRIHLLSQTDIERLVRDKLEDNERFLLLGEQERDNLFHCIVSKSDGVFLWVVLIVKAVEEGLYNGDEVSELEEKAAALPTELEDLFKALLDSIHPSDRKYTYQVLMVSLLNASPGVDSDFEPLDLALLRYSFLEDFSRDPGFAIQAPQREMSGQELQDRLKRTRRRLNGKCKGLLSIFERSDHRRIRESYLRYLVKLTHRSIIEFLQSDWTQVMMEEYLGGFQPLQALCHTLLAQVKFLSLENYVLSDDRHLRTELGRCLWQLGKHYGCMPESFLTCFAAIHEAVIQTAKINCSYKYTGSDFITSPLDKEYDIVYCGSGHTHILLSVIACIFAMHEYIPCGYSIDKEYLPESRLQNNLSLTVSTLIHDTFALPEIGNDAQERNRAHQTLRACFQLGVSPNRKIEGLSVWESYIQYTAPLCLLMLPYDTVSQGIEIFLEFGAHSDYLIRFGLGKRLVNPYGQLIQMELWRGKKPVKRSQFALSLPPKSLEFVLQKKGQLSLLDLVEISQPKDAKAIQERIQQNSRQRKDEEHHSNSSRKKMINLEVEEISTEESPSTHYPRESRFLQDFDQWATEKARLKIIRSYSNSNVSPSMFQWIDFVEPTVADTISIPTVLEANTNTPEHEDAAKPNPHKITETPPRSEEQVLEENRHKTGTPELPSPTTSELLKNRSNPNYSR